MSQKLVDNLSFKTLMFPYWFGSTTEQWESLVNNLQEFQDETFNALVDSLLAIEDSPNYWIASDAWPHPDSEYLTRLCEVIDGSVPNDFSLQARTFCLAWSIQSIRHAMSDALIRIQQFRILNA